MNATRTLPAQAQVTADGWTATVTHDSTIGEGTGRYVTIRNVWHWEIRSTTDAAEWQPVREWTGTDLTSAMDVNDPDPIAALVTLGAFLDDYADVRVLDPQDTGALFHGLPQDAARAIADAIALDFPEDPEDRECEGCLAEPGEPCRPGCLSQVDVEREPAPAPVTRWRVSVLIDVAADRDPRAWDWTTLIDVEDDADTADWSTLTVEKVQS